MKNETPEERPAFTGNDRWKTDAKTERHALAEAVRHEAFSLYESMRKLRTLIPKLIETTQHIGLGTVLNSYLYLLDRHIGWLSEVSDSESATREDMASLEMMRLIDDLQQHIHEKPVGEVADKKTFHLFHKILNDHRKVLAKLNTEARMITDENLQLPLEQLAAFREECEAAYLQMEQTLGAEFGTG
jgi:hypothetical protein